MKVKSKWKSTPAPVDPSPCRRLEEMGEARNSALDTAFACMCQFSDEDLAVLERLIALLADGKRARDFREPYEAANPKLAFSLEGEL